MCVVVICVSTCFNMLQCSDLSGPPYFSSLAEVLAEETKKCDHEVDLLISVLVLDSQPVVNSFLSNSFVIEPATETQREGERENHYYQYQSERLLSFTAAFTLPWANMRLNSSSQKDLGRGQRRWNAAGLVLRHKAGHIQRSEDRVMNSTPTDYRHCNWHLYINHRRDWRHLSFGESENMYNRTYTTVFIESL